MAAIAEIGERDGQAKTMVLLDVADQFVGQEPCWKRAMDTARWLYAMAKFGIEE